MRAFVKFGGSVITDKTVPETPDLAAIAQLAADVCAARAADPTLELVLSHGSGSYGHTYARRYNVHRGLALDADHVGYALTSAAALRLNRLVVEALLAADVPALSVQPSASARSTRGRLVAWHTDALEAALARRLVPVVHGDVAFDDVQGTAIISTEQLLSWLTALPTLRPDLIVLVGEQGVFTANPHVDPHATLIPHIGPATISAALAAAGGSHGTDVTGGMRSKLELMWQLVQAHPTLRVHLIGTAPGLLLRALTGNATGEGTMISASDT